MARRTRREHINQELRKLQEDLSELSIRVAALQCEPPPRRELQIGDRVQFYINGSGYVEGTIVGKTAQRVRVRYGSTILLRAPQNVTLLE